MMAKSYMNELSNSEEDLTLLDEERRAAGLPVVNVSHGLYQVFSSSLVIYSDLEVFRRSMEVLYAATHL